MASERALPRGPHQLSRDEVSESQRSRLLAALRELMAEGGFSAVTIGSLARRARVSRAAFYEHFRDKEHCLLEAYDEWAAVLLDAMSMALGADEGWEQFVERSLRTYLAALEADRVAALAFLVHMEAAGATARARRREAMHGFAALLAARHQAVRERDPRLAPLPDAAFLGFILGVRELVREELEERPDRDLTELVPDLLVWLTAMVRGA